MAIFNTLTGSAAMLGVLLAGPVAAAAQAPAAPVANVANAPSYSDLATLS